MLDVLCQRWHIAPSALLDEDAGLVLGIVGVIGEGERGAAVTPPSEDEQRLMTLMGATSVG